MFDLVVGAGKTWESEAKNAINGVSARKIPRLIGEGRRPSQCDVYGQGKRMPQGHSRPGARERACRWRQIMV